MLGELGALVRRFLDGDRSVVDRLAEVGFIERGEPLTRSYVLYKALKSGINVSSYVRRLEWREFEEFIRYVFSEFGYNVVANIRLECDGGAEFDIVAWSRDVAFVVEAKRWRVGGGRWEEVARIHLQKVTRCLHKLLAFSPSVVPLVVTSTDASFISRGVPVVPAWKIGSFLASFDHFKDQITILR